MIALMELFIAFKKRNIKIGEDDEVFIPTRSMQELVRDYAPFRDACLKMKGYHSRGAGVCDRVIGYTDAFDDLFIRLILEQKKRMSGGSPLQSVVTKEFPKSANNYDDHNYELIGNLEPGADMSHYHQTEKSERYYIWIQNIPRVHKRIIYGGHTDFDIRACHPTIFWKEIMRGWSDNDDLRLMIEDPDAFLDKVIAWGVYHKLYPRNPVVDERDAAKVCRSRLFFIDENTRFKKSRIAWYDELQVLILSELQAAGISNAHQYFARMERKIIEQAIGHLGEASIALLIHDGMIVKGITDLDRVVAELEAVTHYTWKAEPL
jgi:hypothetical protein